MARPYSNNTQHLNREHNLGNNNRKSGYRQQRSAQQHKSEKRDFKQADAKPVTSGPLNNVTGQRNAFPIVLDSSYDYDYESGDGDEDNNQGVEFKRANLQCDFPKEVGDNYSKYGYESDGDPPMDAMTYLLQVRKEAERCPSFVTKKSVNKLSVQEDQILGFESNKELPSATRSAMQNSGWLTGTELNYGNSQGTTEAENKSEPVNREISVPAKTEIEKEIDTIGSKARGDQKLTIPYTSPIPDLNFRPRPNSISATDTEGIILSFEKAKRELMDIIAQKSPSAINSDTEIHRVQTIIKSLPNNFTSWRKFILNPRNHPSDLLLSQPEFNLPLVYKLIVYCEQLVNKKIDRNLSLWVWSLLVRVPRILAGEEIGIIRSLAKKCAKVKKNMANNHNSKQVIITDSLTLQKASPGESVDVEFDGNNEAKIIADFSLDMVVILVGIFWRQSDLLDMI
ncbi:hypothetical protein NADFUDRAFT_82070 [Nadsonia fulvescens var. elongata DSM 6958]|uniref:Uncharacterized protein n=1 Tax=Nadsonia fulvescens var. elongata DSM 6958 TaxID=857566 RepID=A0A1E3PRS1_9ASCO|nr:hypothetical protein NADFUDRAFT_82070 [Nadsonia fulvescens var. elongata DSM 6958]